MRSAAFIAASVAVRLGVAGPLQQHKPWFDWDDTEYLIAFGDSYTYVQGTAGYPIYSFIGDYLHLPFTPETLLTNSINQSFFGTAEGGPNWVEYITGCGLKPGLTRPKTCKRQLWDFAFAGADYSLEFLPLHHNFTTPMVNQTQQYLTYAEPVIGKAMEKKKALVAIWIGINDINDSDKLAVDFPTFYSSIHDALFAQSVQPLYDAGYHNYLFINLPPLDRTPSNQKSAAPLPNATMVDWWNESLKRHTSAFAKNHPAAKAMVYDANTFFNSVMDHPSRYGVVNTTDFCPGYLNATVLTDPGAFGCTDLNGYFWFNSGHLTSHMHKVMSADLIPFLRSQTTR
ncbi:lysophospholipase A [Lophiotrema nucula]|uniref:Lysophospholipase A n=1 Tax=Lophiotrema nucula TaxID=690887 RepID=A0A6A5YIH7_9PLEO|nr:lysophospholipase A [Lophiotrema nucula]